MSLTGPPYPPPPQDVPDNSIGHFIIGVSPVGTIIPFSYWDTIISQYGNSTIITTLVADFQQWIDQTANLDAFYDNIWNISTAQGYGLDVWGRIVGVQRTVQVQIGKYFGFNEQTPATVEPFGPGGVGPFYSGVLPTTNYQLADQSFRQLIFAKALSNISSGSCQSINQILLALFPKRGNCFVTDGGNMTMTYTFQFALTSVELAIVSESGVLPKPVGVAVSVVQSAPTGSQGPFLLFDETNTIQLTDETGTNQLIAG